MGIFMGMTLIAAIIAGIVLFKEYCDKKDREKIAEEERERKAIAEKEHREFMASVKRQMQLMEVLRQAKLVGDKETEADILNGNYDGKLPEELSNGMWTSIFENLTILNIAGINYRGNLSAYVGDFNGVLVPDPKNDYDPNAIMIKCEDGKHLGYVPENLTDMVRDIVGSDFQRYRITGRIFEHEDDSMVINENDKPRRYFTGYINLVA
jgi:hypothetical protein